MFYADSGHWLWHTHSSIPLVLFAVFTDDELLGLARLRYMYQHNKINEITEEHKRLEFMKQLYDSGKLSE